MKTLVLESTSAISAWMNRENTIMSDLFEANVTNRQSILLANAIAAFAVLVSVEAGLSFCLAKVAWFGWSLNLCKKGGLK